MQVYLIRNAHGEYKIGFTSKQVTERIVGLQTGASSELVVVSSYKTKWARQMEGILHRQHRSKKLKGEWFALTLEDELGFQDYCKKIETNLEYLEKHKIENY
jgi:hypothetical protein